MAIAVRDCKLFIALISSNYVNDGKCCDAFKYARVTLNKPILLVVIGKGMEWRQSPLGILVCDEVRKGISYMVYFICVTICKLWYAMYV